MSSQDKTLQMKLLSVILVWVAFAVLFFTVQSGSESTVWIGLVVMAAANIFLAARN